MGQLGREEETKRNIKTLTQQKDTVTKNDIGTDRRTEQNNVLPGTWEVLN